MCVGGRLRVPWEGVLAEVVDVGEEKVKVEQGADCVGMSGDGEGRGRVCIGREGCRELGAKEDNRWEFRGDGRRE